MSQGKSRGKNKKGGSTVEIVTKIAEPLARKQNVELWDVVFEKIGSDRFLRLIIDKEEGVTIEDCEKFSRAVDQLIDEADPISEGYYLEVSSPGMGRELTKPSHFEKLMGRNIKVMLYRPVEKQKEFTGELLEYDNGDVTILADGSELSFEKAQIAKVRVYDDDLFVAE